MVCRTVVNALLRADLILAQHSKQGVCRRKSPRDISGIGDLQIGGIENVCDTGVDCQAPRNRGGSDVTTHRPLRTCCLVCPAMNCQALGALKNRQNLSFQVILKNSIPPAARFSCEVRRSYRYPSYEGAPLWVFPINRTNCMLSSIPPLVVACVLCWAKLREDTSEE